MKEILDPNPTPLAVARFDPAQAREFADRSTSEQTRRAYARVVREFFASIGNPDPRTVAPAQVREWRDRLKSKRQKPATVSFKLSVIPAFFSYLEAIVLVNRNPADVKLVLPPALPEKMSGRALTPEEIRKLLTGPDKRRTEGARDYALMLGMLRLGLSRIGDCLVALERSLLEPRALDNPAQGQRGQRTDTAVAGGCEISDQGLSKTR